MKIGFLLYESVHNQKDAASSRIRGKWLIKYMPEAEEFCYGQKYDAVIFQKVYLTEYAKMFKGIKIFDLCDPDWVLREPVRQMIELCDACTVPTEAFKEFLSEVTDKPIYVIPDRHDLAYFRKQKKHKGRAKEVVWYGYKHNSHVLKSVIDSLKRYKLGLSIITEEYVMIADAKEGLKERWTKWDLKTVNKEVQKSDIVIMPGSMRPNDRFKSNNKTINAYLLGMPVANCAEDLKKFLFAEERQKEADKNYEIARKEYDVRSSVKQLRDIIEEIKCQK